MTANPHVELVEELFVDAGANAHQAAERLRTRIAQYPDPSISHAAIKELEDAGDELTRRIVEALLRDDADAHDRQELYELASAVDDVVDHVEHVSDLLDLYKVEAAMQQALDQCDVLVRATELLHQALGMITTPAQAEGLLVAIKVAENEGDQLERRAIAALFEHELTSPRAIIQWKDIFEGLEAAIDACERSALIIGNLMFRA